MAEPAECRHGNPAQPGCPFCAMHKLENRIEELEYMLARRDDTIEELNGTIDGLRYGNLS